MTVKEEKVETLKEETQKDKEQQDPTHTSVESTKTPPPPPPTPKIPQPDSEEGYEPKKETFVDSNVKEDIQTRILRHLDQQSETIAKQNKVLEDLAKKNEDLNKQLATLQSKVNESLPTVVGPFDYEAASNLLDKQYFIDEEKRMREDYDMIRGIFKQKG